MTFPAARVAPEDAARFLPERFRSLSLADVNARIERLKLVIGD